MHPTTLASHEKQFGCRSITASFFPTSPYLLRRGWQEKKCFKKGRTTMRTDAIWAETEQGRESVRKIHGMIRDDFEGCDNVRDLFVLWSQEDAWETEEWFRVVTSGKPA
jgi:hypothetical protein